MVTPARLDESAAAPGRSQAGLAALLKDGVTGYTDLLTPRMQSSAWLPPQGCST